MSAHKKSSLGCQTLCRKAGKFLPVQRFTAVVRSDIKKQKLTLGVDRQAALHLSDENLNLEVGETETK